jgi:hypothetical protein
VHAQPRDGPPLEQGRGVGRRADHLHKREEDERDSDAHAREHHAPVAGDAGDAGKPLPLVLLDKASEPTKVIKAKPLKVK